MASNASNNIYDSEITDKRIVPYAKNNTGTITTQGIAIVGVGTLFTTEMRKGSFLVKLSANEFREVDRVDSDTLAYLKSAFTADISSSTPSVINQSDARVVEVSVSIPFLNSGGGQNADGKICYDGSGTLKRFPAGEVYTPSKANRDRSGTQDHISPVIVDFTGTEGIITVIR